VVSAVEIDYGRAVVVVGAAAAGLLHKMCKSPPPSPLKKHDKNDLGTHTAQQAGQPSCVLAL
jgi:hypothetical protein